MTDTDGAKKPDGPSDASGAGNGEARPAASSDGEQKPLDGVLRVHPPTDGEHAARLADCSHAFARGDFGAARRLAQEVTKGKPTDAERSFADEIVRRTAIDPVALGVGVGCFILFWVVIWLTVWR